ncbi:MAG: DUF6624 domain-containing protein [Acidimicrobiales bacterium]
MESPELGEELERMADEDSTVRQRLLAAGQLLGGYNPEMRAVHRRNGDRLEEILDQTAGWLGYRLVGEAGSEAAFLIAQHDIANPNLIRRVRQLYAAAVDNADADPRRLANLEDRIRYFEGRPQWYGTHVGWDTDGQFGPWPPVEEPDGVDERRGRLGLPPLAEAINTAGQGRTLRRVVEEVLDEHRQAAEFAKQAGWRGDESAQSTAEQDHG